MAKPDTVRIYETLRDAEQNPDTFWEESQKSELVNILNDLGSYHRKIDVEVGMPGANEKDRRVISSLDPEKLDHLNLYAFSGTIARGETAQSDRIFQRVVDCGLPNITIVAKGSADQVKRALGSTQQDHLENVRETVKYLRKHGKKVNLDVEHAFDGFSYSPDFFFKVLNTAVEAGAEELTLCDTRGNSKAHDVGLAVKEVMEYFKGGIGLGVHCHDDKKRAITNSEAAVDAGARTVQGTFLYELGERCANADLATIVGNLTEEGFSVFPDKRLERLTPLVRAMEIVGGIEHNPSRPYVGRNAFAHKGGYHQSAVLKHPDLYEHADPSRYGNRRRFVVSDLGGRAGLRYVVEQLGLKEMSSGVLDRLSQKIKKGGLERELLQKTDDSLALWLLMETRRYENPFSINYVRILDEERVGQSTNVESVVHFDSIKPSLGYGVGPVNSLHNAITEGLRYADDKRLRTLGDDVNLKGFYVKTINGGDGTAAMVKVEGIFDYKEKRIIHTSCVHDNIRKASERVIVDALKVALIPPEEYSKNGHH